MERKFDPTLKWMWWFIWDDDSVLSWIVNILLAFILIKFLVYPALGFALSTSHPIVAVVSSSMEHDAGFEKWWESNKAFYEGVGMGKPQFSSFTNGFNKGDLIMLKGKSFDALKQGDVIVFRTSSHPEPVIHRIIKVQGTGASRYVQTKGDNNIASNPDELRIEEGQYIGNGLIRIPWLGWVKIGFVGLLKMVGVA